MGLLGPDGKASEHLVDISATNEDRIMLLLLKYSARG